MKNTCEPTHAKNGEAVVQSPPLDVNMAVQADEFDPMLKFTKVTEPSAMQTPPRPGCSEPRPTFMFSAFPTGLARAWFTAPFIVVGDILHQKAVPQLFSIIIAVFERPSVNSANDFFFIQASSPEPSPVFVEATFQLQLVWTPKFAR